MSKRQPYLLEVTQALSDCARSAGFSFGEDTAVVAVQHMLWQTVDLFRTIAEMGVNPTNIFALGKIYSNSQPVIETLREMGVAVVDTSVPEPGEFQSYFKGDVDKLWQVASNTFSERRIKRVIVLDDGGVCLTSVPSDVVRQYAVCGVEQTTRGMVLIKKNPPPFAVMTWARAGLKLEIGSPIFSQYFIEKLNTEFLGGGSLEGERLGIIGLGSIGKGLATLLVPNNEVLFYDSDPDLNVPRLLRTKTTRVDSLEELMLHCDYVLGCSGRNPFKYKWPLNYRAGINLVSVSSGDQEFGPIIRDLKQKPDFKVEAGTWDIICDQVPSRQIHIAYLGYPYSFVSRGIEALPTHIAQFDTGGLLAALVQARLFLGLCETSVEQNTGIHRVTPKAQRFIYERWSKAMQDRMINLTDRYRLDPALLTAVQHEEWFNETTEPHPGEDYTPVRAVEKLMDELISQ